MDKEKVINSPAPGSKKSEGKKRKPPFSPYREKAKGKETSRVLGSNLQSCARSRVSKALDHDLDLAVSQFRGTERNRRTWAAIAWRVGVANFHYALVDKLSENASDATPLRSPASAFQAFLDRRFPKPEGAR